MNWFKGAVVAAGIAACSLMAQASADVAAYNKAMQQGDMDGAWTAAQKIWAGWDQDDPMTALFAREFGFAAFAAGEPEEARKLARFLLDKGASLKTPDDQPDVALVLLRAAELRIEKSAAGRDALLKALEARSRESGYDMTSVMAWEDLYAGYWQAGDFPKAQLAAAGGATFMQRGGGSFDDRISNAEIVATSAEFFHNRNRVSAARNEIYTAMADVHDRIVDRLDATADAAARASLWKSMWRARAWTSAIATYLTSTDFQTGSRLTRKLEERNLKFPEVGEVPAGDYGPRCEGGFRGPTLAYPSAKEFQGMVGAVIVRLRTDDQGKVIGATELASVPAEGFGSGVVETKGKWRYVAGDDAKPGCTLRDDDYVYTVTFRFG